MAKPRDVQGIIEIYAPYVKQHWSSFEESVPGEKEMIKRLKSGMKKYPWLVAEHERTVAGYAYAGPHRSRKAYRWTSEVSAYIHPEFKRTGVASRLYLALFELMRAQNIYQALAGISMPNRASSEFHRYMGFHQIALYSNVGFKMHGWRDVEWLSKTLIPHDHVPNEFIPFSKLKKKEVKHTLRRFSEVEGIKKG